MEATTAPSILLPRGFEDIARGLPEDELEFEKNPSDLNALRVIDKQRVLTFVDEINAIPDQELEDRMLVLAIGTGGTISMKTIDDPKGGGGKIKVPSLDFDEIFKHTDKSLQERFVVKGLNALELDSSQMKIDHVRDLAIVASYLEENVKKPFGFFLVVHGTDTMAEASCHMTVMRPNLKKPMIYTGAQSAIGSYRTDAPWNVRESLNTGEQMVRDDHSDVLVVFGDGAFYSYGAQKLHEVSKNAFDSPLHELAADLSTPGARIKLQGWTRKRVSGLITPRVYRGYSHLADFGSRMSEDPGYVEHCISYPGKLGVSIGTFGAGTADEDVVRVTAKAMKKRGIPGFAFNPASFGADRSKEHKEAMYESERKLREAGFHMLRMTPEYARAKFEEAIRRYRFSIGEVIDFMGRQTVGEIPTEQTTRRTPLLRH